MDLVQKIFLTEYCPLFFQEVPLSKSAPYITGVRRFICFTLPHVLTNRAKRDKKGAFGGLSWGLGGCVPDAWAEGKKWWLTGKPAFWWIFIRMPV